MKKITLIASLCAIFMAPSLFAQEAQEVQYVEDETQGYVINDFKDNWFMTLGLGANFYVSKHDIHRDIMDRFAPNVNLSVGKWFTPVWGARLNLEALNIKGLGVAGCYGSVPGEFVNGYSKTRQAELGATLDVMANLTNLFCGYKPGRVYNATFYAGGGAYWTLVQDYNAKNEKDGVSSQDRLLTFHAGIINSFNVSKQVQLSLDLRASAIDGMRDYSAIRHNPMYLDLQAYLGITYLFNNRDWNHPVVPVCPEPVDCTPLINAAVADATADLKAQIKKLQDQLKNQKPQVVTVTEEAPLATVYFPIGKSNIKAGDKKVLEAVAEQMKATEDNYVIYGLADNVTGSAERNNVLREQRAENVKAQLVKYGVEEGRLSTKSVAEGLLSDSNDKYVSLDRAARIEVAK